MGPLLSIIIPIYNVEKYLKQCIDSVRNQTYQNLEIILVDDGASDDSGAICDEYASTDRRIKVIHKINAGQAEARNTGLEVATGDYITFVDSDDWLDLNLYESIMTAIPFQIAIFGCTFVNAENGSCSCIKAVDRAENYCVNQFEIIQKLVNSSLLGYAANKIYAAKILSGIRFADVLFREDLIFNLEVIKKCDRLYLSNSCGYYYRQRSSSTLHDSYYGDVPEVKDVLKKMLIIHPAINEQQNRILSNSLMKVYITDIIGKCVLQNKALDKENQSQAVKYIFGIQPVRKVLRLYGNDCALYRFLTLCYKLHMPNLFLEIYRRRYAK